MRTVKQIDAELKGAKAAVEKANEVVQRLEREKADADGQAAGREEVNRIAKEILEALNIPAHNPGAVFVNRIDVSTDVEWHRYTDFLTRGELTTKIDFWAGDSRYVIERAQR